MDGLPLFQSESRFRSMRERCNNPNHRAFARYGGRGIRVCERWDDFRSFMQDMGPRPDGTSLDRIDNDNGYNPDNCRWATDLEQMSNRSINRIITIDGVSKTVSEWCRHFGISTSTASSRIKKGMEPEAAVSSPARKKVCLKNILTALERQYGIASRV